MTDSIWITEPRPVCDWNLLLVTIKQNAVANRAIASYAVASIPYVEGASDNAWEQYPSVTCAWDKSNV